MSIPGKWEARVPEYKQRPKTVHSYQKGFGVCSSRFDNSHINELPGPGYYEKDIDGKSSLIKATPSFSKKGYGNAFVSKSQQLEDRIRVKAFIPGPGSYNAKMLPSVRSCPKFNQGSQGRVPYVMGPKTPGPSDYSINPNPGAPKLLQNKISATFASASKRESFLEIFSDAPGVGRYEVQAGALSPNGTDYKWAQRKSARFSDRDYDNSVPGPGAYFDEVNVLGSVPDIRNARTAGAYNGPYLGKQNAIPLPNLHTFGADTDRFKHSFIGVIEPNPGPGTYQVANADRVTTKDPPKAFSNVFKSTAPNRGEIVKKPFDRPPGPAYYRPALLDTKTKCQNMDGRWI